MTLSGAGDGLAIDQVGTPLRLLLVASASTDRAAVSEMIVKRFPRAQVQVEVVEGLPAALFRLGQEPLDLVLVDIAPPDRQDGGVVSALSAAHPELPFLVLTGGDEPAIWARIEETQTVAAQVRDDQPVVATAIINALRGNEAEEGARRYLELARGLLDALEAPTCAVDADGRIVATNLAWRDFSRDNGGGDEACGVGADYLDECNRAELHSRGTAATDAAAVGRGIRQVLMGELDQFSHDYPCHSPTELRWFSVRVTPAAINAGRGAVITHVNMTSLREIEQTLAYRTMHDDVTGLPNRTLLADRLEQAASDAERRGRAVAVAHLDLSGQRVNDTLQYGQGDAVLVQVAERLRAHLRPGDTVARESGDKFLVLWRDLDPAGPDDLIALGRGLVQALERPLGAAAPISASVGVARHVAGQDIGRTLQGAALALADATGRGARSVVLFTPEIEEAHLVRTTLEMDLRLALAGPVTQFLVHYQPVVDLASGEVVAVEALLRWEHPVLGTLGPEKFIPMAEETGLIHDLGGWTLQQAVRDAAQLTHRGRELDIAVNFSVLQLDEQTVAEVEGAIEDAGLRPGRLVVEVTESALAADEDAVVRALEALSELGVAIAIDDFGTGYSSLHYLRRYPIDTIKIDREFVAGIGRHVDDESICESIIKLAAAVGATVVGEGVENGEQHAFLRSLGCDLGQGFWWSRPVPLDQLPAALAACAEVSATAEPARTSPSTMPRTPR